VGLAIVVELAVGLDSVVPEGGRRPSTEARASLGTLCSPFSGCVEPYGLWLKVRQNPSLVFYREEKVVEVVICASIVAAISKRLDIAVREQLIVPETNAGSAYGNHTVTGIFSRKSAVHVHQ
jgi:hypothetical protein